MSTYWFNTYPNPALCSSVFFAGGDGRCLPGPLNERLVDYIENDLKTLVTVDREFGDTPSVAFRRVVYRAVARVKSLDRKTTGADVLAAMFDQTESPAAWLLSEHGITQESVLNFISNHDRQGKV